MNFLKKFFNDDNIVVGLYQLNKTAGRTNQILKKTAFENVYNLQNNGIFNTNYKENVLL